MVEWALFRFLQMAVDKIEFVTQLDLFLHQSTHRQQHIPELALPIDLL